MIKADVLVQVVCTSVHVIGEQGPRRALSLLSGLLPRRTPVRRIRSVTVVPESRLGSHHRYLRGVLLRSN